MYAVTVLAVTAPGGSPYNAAGFLDRLAARTATAQDGPQRAILLAADDYSAVSRRVPLSNLYERGRSLGIGVQMSAPIGR